ncbi:MAG: sigma-54 dependent transcriptional regulator [Verrucomicrobiae bacterium]|nr:sigma-54 dependent transcriptional regulator [Verrucomicrobiae bacterium]
MNIERILIMDDDTLLCRFMETHLKRRGYTVSTVNSIADARAALGQGSFDLVFSDIRFPDGDGIEFLRSLRKDNNPILHIMMTGYGSVSSAVESMKLGSSDYLVKPFTVDQIDVALERLETWKRISNENEYFRRQQAEQQGTQELLGKSEGMLRVRSLIERVAATNATVLIQGESGTGKELVAGAIWSASPRRNNPFIKFNCAAVPENLMESELFGHEKGAFTGAYNRRDGRFQMADGGTLLLDEVSEIPISLQAKLLRVLQESEFERVGGNKTIKVDVRILATTNRNLKVSVEKGEFREDLYYRLNVFPIIVPPLRERQEDIDLLLQYYLQKHAGQYGKPPPELSPECARILRSSPWKGNIRELQNTAARAVILHEGNRLLQAEDFGIVASQSVPAATTAPASTSPAAASQSPGAPVSTLDQMERQLIEKALAQNKGNKTHAARALGISVRTLRNKLHEYRIADSGQDGDDEGDAVN